MNTNKTSPKHGTHGKSGAGDLDQLLSDFFKSQLKQPWPKAPVPVAHATVEPSELVATRTTESPRNAPAKFRDNTARARFTLAASVALLLGTGWLLTNGYEPGTRPAGCPTPAISGPGMLSGGSADGDKHLPLKKMGEDKAKGNDGGIKIDLKDGN